ncbi:MAG: arginine--tRNA ligase [Candidatus Kapabacteria bacterium]|jgi:arginyl-tRNA synthetase|nr:arginine--tRNA ligase [Candidatus Kapabacteria bacterium]
MQKKYITPVFRNALNKIGVPEETELHFEAPKNPDHGDFSCNVAMRSAKAMKKPPRAIAEEIIAALDYDAKLIENVSIAGPGFINIKFTDGFYAEVLKTMDALGDQLGRSNLGEGRKVNVEYISCNPTGLLHLGHGRNASIGDTVSNLYEWTGWDVTREYYFNNAGNQMNNLAKSVYARYMEALGNADFPFPEDGYRGEYIKQIAAEIKEEFGDKYKSGTEDDITFFRKAGEKWCFREIKKTLTRMNIEQDVFFNEDSLYTDGKIDAIIQDFKKLDLAYEKDEALWLKLSEMGLEEDRVIVKSSGEPTYRLPDMAYHREKFELGYDLMVELFGADHIATVPDVQAGIKALGYDTNKVRTLIHQFVTLSENGEQVKMSKRTGKNYTLDDLLDEVGPDVVRFFFLMRSVNTHLEFDLGLAREQSDKNPVFYLQYAHARICSMIAKAEDLEIKVNDNADFTLLNHKAEISLIKYIMNFGEAVKSSSTKCEPQVLTDFLREAAAAFHVFYHECRIISADSEELRDARLKLASIARIMMKNGLVILGITTPEHM